MFNNKRMFNEAYYIANHTDFDYVLAVEYSDFYCFGAPIYDENMNDTGAYYIDLNSNIEDETLFSELVEYYKNGDDNLLGLDYYVLRSTGFLEKRYSNKRDKKMYCHKGRKSLVIMRNDAYVREEMDVMPTGHIVNMRGSKIVSDSQAFFHDSYSEALPIYVLEQFKKSENSQK